MNDAAMEQIQRLSQREYSAVEYRNRMVRMQNMGCICHCSAEIDLGTLLYFSVNDMYLGEGSFVVLLFSETSPPTADQREGRDVYGRMYAYALIDEVVREVLTGHYSFYSSELDGRLAVIVSFPFGLMPDRSVVDFLENSCGEISRLCRERYDMSVVAYVSDHTDDIRSISSLYSKLTDRATLHRYTEHVFLHPAYRVGMLNPQPPIRRIGSMEQAIHELVRRFLAGEDFHPLVSDSLADLAENRASSVDELKRMFGDYFEEFCLRCDQLGVKIRKEHYREELFRVVSHSIHWREAEAWMHGMLDKVSADYAARIQRAGSRLFDQAREYIRANLSDPDLSVDRCAAAAGGNPSALSKAFRRQIGISPAAYIRQERLTLALELLKGGHTVRDTCQRCGFASTETFHRVFKATYGITPGHLRRTGRLSRESGGGDAAQ